MNTHPNNEMLNVEIEVENTIRKLLRVIYRLDDEHSKLASESIKCLVHANILDTELVDSLVFYDALLMCACLERFSFRAGRDYGVYQCGSKYGLMIKHECLLIANSVLQDLQKMRIIRRIASTILKEWRGIFSKCEGDTYEALDLAYEVMAVRNKLSDERCPSCGRASGTIIKEAVRGRTYSIYAKKTCCNHREKITLRP